MKPTYWPSVTNECCEFTDYLLYSHFHLHGIETISLDPSCPTPPPGIERNQKVPMSLSGSKGSLQMDNGSQGHLSWDDIQAAPGPARIHSSQDMSSPRFWSAVLSSVRGTMVNHNASGVRGRDAEGTQWLRDLGHSTWRRQTQCGHFHISEDLSQSEQTWSVVPRSWAMTN